MLIPREEWNTLVRQYVRVAFGLDSSTAASYAESLNEAYKNGFSPNEAVDKDMDSDLN